ncbi:hypothetical protein T07_1461 [Trichinella nelsoni]|uniref:Transmembrane protein n=1 Tax=Trichinella nelsoni TaxID=6336 RepID=A0A0V0SBJ8_9BILA|nr:hypothetical protein T07_1461 [Trichinella nelsoni]
MDPKSAAIQINPPMIFKLTFLLLSPGHTDSQMAAQLFLATGQLPFLLLLFGAVFLTSSFLVALKHLQVLQGLIVVYAAVTTNGLLSFPSLTWVLLYIALRAKTFLSFGMRATMVQSSEKAYLEEFTTLP